MIVTFGTDAAFNAFYEWILTDKKIAKKIMELINDIKHTPYSGLGKPEPLKYEYFGCWSRRITDEHRLVYKIENDTIVVLSCKSHYK